MRKLPLLVERSVRESRMTRFRLADEFERRLRAKSGPPITCQRGCHHCCYFPVLTTVLEGIDLFRYLASEHLWSHDLQQVFHEHATRTWGQSAQVWMLSQIPCPLITDKGDCLIYKKRPFLCRITVSLGDPHYCHPHRFNDDSTQIVARKPSMEECEKDDVRLLKQHKLSLTYLPLSSAILYGEKVCKENIELAEVDMQVLADFVKGF